MIKGAVKDIVASLGHCVIDDSAVLEETFRGVTIDSRTCEAENLFICIVGDKHDGHDFINQAIARGSRVILVNRERIAEVAEYSQAVFIGVDNTFRALHDLARRYLNQINCRKIALTGTNGKTTSKNLIANVLGARYRTCSTRGNLNNQFGVPLSIFEFAPNCEVAVFEFAMSTPGEIASLVELVDPDIRVILNIGPAHLETMKTIDAIAEAKFEILQHAKETDWAVLNMDDPNIRSRSYRYRINKLSYGTSREHEVHPERVFCNGSGHAHLIYKGNEIILPILGNHHISNALAAIAVARVMDVPLTLVKSRIETYLPTGFRMTQEEVHGITIINDAYNANPVSVAGALDTVSSIQTTGKRVVVLGDMLELGDRAEEYHRQVGARLANGAFDTAILIGQYSEIVRESALKAGFDPDRIGIADDCDEIVDRLSKSLIAGDLLLLKASRALRLERVEQGLKAVLGRRN